MLLHSYETLTPYSLLLELPALVHNPERSLLHAGLLWSRAQVMSKTRQRVWN